MRYASDTQLPGMAYAAVANCPVLGGRVDGGRLGGGRRGNGRLLLRSGAGGRGKQ